MRTSRTRFGAAVGTGNGVTTKILMGVLVAVYVLNLISGGRVLGSLALINYAVAGGEFWRLLTYGLTSAGLFGTAMNILVLWLVGRALEAELGGGRFLALYLVAGLGGSTVCFLLGPPGLAGVGASAAILGLLATNAIGKYKGGEDIRPDIGLLIVLVLYSLLVGFRGFGWLGMLGGLAVGGLAGAVLAYAPRENRTAIQVVGLLAVVLACLAGVVAKIVL